MRNITNGQFRLDYHQEDKVGHDYKFLKVPGNDSLDLLRRDHVAGACNYYIENIRTGEFSQISENYMLESAKETKQPTDFVTNTFDTEMKMLMQGFVNKMNKCSTFFQGLFAGMSLLYTITLSLSVSVSADLVRVEDQAIRVISLLSTFGALYSLILAKHKNDYVKIKGTAAEIDQASKSLVLCTIEMIFYSMSYIIYNVSHSLAVRYNIQGNNYDGLKQTTTAYTALCLLGWIFTNINTYKYSD